jgi:1-acyl-sn-glycerol-3-phosphate acyltransferase
MVSAIWAVLGSLCWALTRPLAILGLVARLPLAAWHFSQRGKDAFAFRPPRTSPFLIRLVRALMPLLLRYCCRMERVDVPDEDLERVRKLTGQRVVLCPNHPTGWDPAVIFQLSTVLGEDFHYMACIEAFAYAPKGWFMQRMGCYSIVRGALDRESFRTTHELLLEGKRWLVIFPEGEACGHNDMVMPFQDGVVRMAFRAAEELHDNGLTDPLYVVPISLRYRFSRDMRREIGGALSRLERKLGIKPASRALELEALYARLVAVGVAVVATVEQEHGIRPRPGAHLEDRMQQVKEVLVSRIAAALGVSLRPNDSLLDRIRALYNAANHVVHEEPEGSDYERDLHRRRQQDVRPLYDDLDRVLRFVATRSDYVGETLSAERFLETIARLECEVLGEVKWYGPRLVALRIGEPIDLVAHIQAYKQDKRNAVLGITRQLESAVMLMLAASNQSTKGTT